MRNLSSLLSAWLPGRRLAGRRADLIRAFVSLVVLFVAVAFFLYPAFLTLRVASDSRLRRTGRVSFMHPWFRSLTHRYDDWAEGYLQSHRARRIDTANVSATEWPMFGSVFFLLTCQELAERKGEGQATVPADGPVRRAVEKAARIVASPVTATWVREKWGENYLHEENVFYRMLLIMGLSAYEDLTGDRRYHARIRSQEKELSEELMAARLHILDDYPGECYPNDVLWAVAAIRRAGSLTGRSHSRLVRATMEVFNGPLRTPIGLPAYQVDRPSGRILQKPRGCGNSGILIFAPELDPAISSEWYRAYVDAFWVNNRWVAGFRETPRGSGRSVTDVDSGPVIGGLGSVASAFGIGAARAHGRYDHAAPLTMEAFACSWPTPFGLLIPGVMGKMGADSWCLGEVALLFCMSRPTAVEKTVAYRGPVPLVVWLLAAGYSAIAIALIGLEIRGWLRWRRRGSAEEPDRSDMPSG